MIRSQFRPAVIALLVLAVTLPAASESAKSLYNKGKDAEARQNYEQAYDFYKQAFSQKPQDLSYRSAYERLRFLAGASHVHRGQLMREAGKLDDALLEFQKAVEIDPSSAIARQEVFRTKQMIEAAKTAGPKASVPPSALDRRVQEAAGPVELAAIQNIPLTLKMTQDTKIVYETVGRIAGINVLFDPDYTSRQIKVDLNSVSLEEALEIVAMESKTFWRPVTPNTIFIAADNPAKRKEIEQSVIKTFYLANLSQPTELQDVVNALRQILEISRIQPLQSEGAIIVRGTPDQIALAEKLVDDLDKSKPEVIVDVAIMQISRDKTRNLGINPPTSASVQLQPNINTNVSTPNSNGTTTPTTSTTNGITLNALGNLNATDFQVTISQATATALFSDNNSKLIQNPQIRAVDGQKASLKIGERIPVATGSFQPGIGGVGINPLVNTQFNYQDVGVNIDITPKVHSNGDVTLKITMEVSAVDSFQNIGGISQPVIGQRKIDHEVRLKEGEANLLGGMLEDSQTRSLSGIPGLAQIPILKYLFGQTNTERRQTETVFVLIPHIVRGLVISDLNQRGIDVGTANSIELRQISHAPPPEAPSAPQGPSASAAPQTMAPAMSQSPAQPAAPITTGASFAFDPPSISQRTGSTFAVNIMLSGVQNAYSVPVEVNYDPKLLQVINVSNGPFLSQDGQTVALMHRDDDTTGSLQINATRPPGASGVSGQGAVATLTFKAKAPGTSTLAISRGGARDPAMQALPVAGTVAQVAIQ
ncbi:MAG: cohesin domain-containing protein [Terriglobales bacterium]|nr:cohesin domain-containing protein [Terriglobales bacterium]